VKQAVRVMMEGRLYATNRLGEVVTLINPQNLGNRVSRNRRTEVIGNNISSRGSLKKIKTVPHAQQIA